MVLRAGLAMQEVFQDLRYGLRMLLRTPAASAVAILALGLGIGANSAIFSLINAILFRSLPYPDAEQLVTVWENKLAKGLRRQLVSPLDYQSYAELNRTFDLIGAVRNELLVLTGRDLPDRIEAAAISPSVFQLLGMHPVLGRAFAADEDQPQKNARVVLSEGLWHRRFAADPNILGAALILDGKSYSVIGIAPRGFQLPGGSSELWIPYTVDPKQLTPSQQGLHTLQVLARLKAGVSLRQSEIEMRAIARRLEEGNPNTNAGYSAEVIPLREQVVGNIGLTLWTLTGAVAFVLLIACANVANLLLARSAAREKEIAVRSSLGANPGRIVRQMLTESVLLSLMGGVLGLALAFWGAAALARLAPSGMPRVQEISVDWRVLSFTLLLSVATGIVFGMAPALASVRFELNSVLRGSGRSSTASVRGSRVRDIFVISEVACCVVLLVGAGLLVRSFLRLQGIDPGFRADHVLTMQLAPPANQYSGSKIVLFYKQLLDRVIGLPGVQSAGICRFLPLSGSDAGLNFQIEGQPTLAVADQPRAKFRASSSGYFETMGIPLIRGRSFDRTDGEQTPKVVVINEAAAQRFWPGEDPIGKRILSGADDNAWSTIVGVVGNVKHAGLDTEASPETYYHYLQIPPDVVNFAEATMFLVIRTNADPSSITSAVRMELRSLDSNQPAFNVKTMDQVMQASMAQPRFRMLLMAGFAGVALVLAAIGLYGVMAYAVTQRINELGVRMALGAQRSDIGRLVVSHGIRMTVIGIGIGIVFAAAMAWVISRLLFGVRVIDLPTFGAACFLTIAVALVASLFPAIRAIRVDPGVALRAE